MHTFFPRERQKHTQYAIVPTFNDRQYLLYRQVAGMLEFIDI